MNRLTIPQELARQQIELTTRRHFLRDCTTGLGAAWLASQTMGDRLLASEKPVSAMTHPARVKSIIYLHMVGAPSQLDLFEYRPELVKYDGKDCPQEYLEGRRFAFIQGTPQLLGPQFPFKQYGQSGAWVSDRLPHIAKHVDDICFIRTMETDQFNHGPAELMVHTGQARMGYPSIGAWTTWGLGNANENLPGFIVLLSGGRSPRAGNALWGSGFLPSVYQGVQCRSKGDAILNMSNPENISREVRRDMLDALASLNQESYQTFQDPETLTRISQYEMAYRMQAAMPEVADISTEPESIHQLYGTKPGGESFANNCLLARRLVESGVRYIQLFDWGWDSHGADKDEAINVGFSDKCRDIDQPISALLTDLKQRDMLKDTLVVWSGEFGRTPMRENRGGTKMPLVGRDHNPAAFTLWMAGGGVKPGYSYGELDDLGYTAAANPVPLRDFHATLLHMLGMDHNKLSYYYQGLNQKLTGVKPAKVVHDILA